MEKNDDENFEIIIMTLITPFIRNNKIDIIDVPDVIFIVLDIYNNFDQLKINKNNFIDVMTFKLMKLFNDKNLIKEYQRNNFQKMLTSSLKLALLKIKFKKSKCVFF